jgi:protein-L-isoaspartate(D-aspartate) O-methyltransferase
MESVFPIGTQMQTHRKTSFALILTFALLAPPFSHSQSLRDWPALAREMVDKEVAAAGVTNERVLRAMRETPRHEFVPQNQRQYAYYDMALPIGDGQTISPPFIVAYMTQEIDPQPSDRVLEIGTGSGYQAAILSPLVKDVYTIEIVEPLGRRADRTLKRLEYKNVFTRIGDGYQGWPEAAPFDKIIVTCSPEKVPQPLVDQLRDGGLMIVPVGERYQQNLYLFRKEAGELKSEALRPTLFVPMTGTAESQRAVRPDPLRPQIVNGGFEEVRAVTETKQDASATAEPSGWHYQRQLSLVTNAADAPQGSSYARFQNTKPGRGAQALQGFAIDGRQVSSLRVSLAVKAANIPVATAPRNGVAGNLPQVVISYYDERRAVIGEEAVGPFSGTFGWRREESTIRVPLRAREAILRVGLLGATGELSVDDVQIEPGS